MGWAGLAGVLGFLTRTTVELVNLQLAHASTAPTGRRAITDAVQEWAHNRRATAREVKYLGQEGGPRAAGKEYCQHY